MTADFLWQQEWREERVEMLHPQTGRKVFVTEERLCTIEKWFDPLFAPAETVAPTAENERYFAPRTVERFVREEYLPSLGYTPPIDEMMRAVRDRFPGVTRDFVRQLKAKYAPGERGRRRKFGGK